MAVDLDKLKWALNDLTETVDYEDQNGVITEITVSNKAEPTAGFKNTGAKFEEVLPRQYLNFILYQQYLAIQDLETRLTALENV